MMFPVEAPDSVEGRTISGDKPWQWTLLAFRRRPSYPKETWIAAAAGIGIVAYLLCRYVIPSAAEHSHWILLAVLLGAGAPLVIDLAQKAFRGEFGSDLLAGFSIVTSIVVGEYLAGSIVVLMLSGGTALEQYATRRASAVLGALAKRLPSIAHRRTGVEILEIRLDEVQMGDVLLVFPHEICPVDGVVLEGDGTMDESYLTGEPYLISKAVGAPV